MLLIKVESEYNPYIMDYNTKFNGVEPRINTVNYVITSEAYATAVEVYDGALDASAEELNKLKDKAKGYATTAIDKAGDFG